MLCGEVDRRDEVIRRLQGERTAFVERIKSLDATMALFDSRLDPAAGGMVRATAGRYGPRGGLIRFVLEQLVAAGPAGLDSRSIRERASVHFNVQVDTAAQRDSFRDTVGWTLRDLFQRKLIEVVSDSRGGRRPKVWRIAAGPTFADLLAQQEAVDDQDPDAP